MLEEMQLHNRSNLTRVDLWLPGLSNGLMRLDNCWFVSHWLVVWWRSVGLSRNPFWFGFLINKHKMACSFAAREIKINWCHWTSTSIWKGTKIRSYSEVHPSSEETIQNYQNSASFVVRTMVFLQVGSMPQPMHHGLQLCPKVGLNRRSFFFFEKLVFKAQEILFCFLILYSIFYAHLSRSTDSHQWHGVLILHVGWFTIHLILVDSSTTETIPHFLDSILFSADRESFLINLPPR